MLGAQTLRVFHPLKVCGWVRWFSIIFSMIFENNIISILVCNFQEVVYLVMFFQYRCNDEIKMCLLYEFIDQLSILDVGKFRILFSYTGFKMIRYYRI